MITAVFSGIRIFTLFSGIQIFTVNKIDLRVCGNKNTANKYCSTRVVQKLCGLGLICFSLSTTNNTSFQTLTLSKLNKVNFK